MKRKTLKQVRFLLSAGSPLTKAQKERLRQELRSGVVEVVKRPRQKPQKGRKLA